MPNPSNGVTAEEQQLAFEKFDTAYPLIKETAKKDAAEFLAFLDDFYQNNEAPDQKKLGDQEYYLRIIGYDSLHKLKELDQAGSPDPEEEKKLVDLFDGIYQEQYKKQYMTPAYLTETKAVRQKNHLEFTPSSVFMYDMKSYDMILGFRKKYKEAVDQVIKHYAPDKPEHPLTPEDQIQFRKSLLLMDKMQQDALRLAEEYQYASSRSWLLDNQKKNLLSQGISENTFRHFSARIGAETDLFTAQLKEVSASLSFVADRALGKEMTGISPCQTQLIRKYELDDIQNRLQKTPGLTFHTKAVATALSSDEVQNDFAGIMADLSAKHWLGSHTDSPEMADLKKSFTELTTLTKDGCEKLIQGQWPADKDMKKMLADVRSKAKHYLEEKDSEGKTLDDRTQMGQTRYLAAQRLVGTLDGMEAKIDKAERKMAFQFMDERANQETDPAYKNLLKNSIGLRRHLSQYLEKAEWDEKDRSEITQDITKLVAIRKVDLDHTLSSGTSNSLWGRQKAGEDITGQITTMLKDDFAITQLMKVMNHDILNGFVLHEGEGPLNLQQCSFSRATNKLLQIPPRNPEVLAKHAAAAAPAPQMKK